MARGRKHLPETQLIELEPAAVAVIETDGRDAAALALHSAEIAERYGDGVPYERERVVAEARFLMAQSAEAMLEAGKRLIQIKENEPHGEFIEIVTGRLGLGKRSAQAMMQAALKYLSPRLKAKAQSVALLGRAKLFDLMVEDDDDIAELADGGTVRGLTLTDMQAMTRREMQAALTKARHDSEAKDRLIETKNKTIDELSTYTPTKGSIARDEEQQRQLKALHEATNAAEVNFIALANVVEAIHAGSGANHASKAMRDRAAQAVQYLVARLAEVIDEHGIEVSLAEGLSVRPDWLDALNADKA